MSFKVFRHKLCLVRREFFDKFFNLSYMSIHAGAVQHFEIAYFYNLEISILDF